MGSRTSASGCDTIRDPDRTTCIASTDPRTLRTQSPKPTETWVPGTELDLDPSKSFAYVFYTTKLFLDLYYTPLHVFFLAFWFYSCYLCARFLTEISEKCCRKTPLP